MVWDATELDKVSLLGGAAEKETVVTARSCGENLASLLKAYGVDTVFGMPGVHTLALYRGIEAAGLRHIGVRHEQGAGFMADGYARASGRPGVCLLISGPGVTNVATPLGQAYSDSVPMLVVTSAIARSEIGLGRGMLHEIADQRAITEPISGMSAMAWEPAQVGAHLARAMALFAAARPRPVHLSIPIDVLDMPSPDFKALHVLPRPPAPGADAVAEAIGLLAGADRVAILAGGGAAHAGPGLTRLAEALGALVVTTIAGKGIVPESHPLSLGSTLQRPETRRVLETADAVLAIGTEIAEPDLYVTADTEAEGGGAPPADPTRLALKGRLIRVDIDPAAIVRDYAPDLAILADAGLTAAALAEAVEARGPAPKPGRAEQASEIRRRNGEGLSALERRHMAVLARVRAALPADALVYADMTQIAYTGCVFFPTDRPRTWHFPVGYGTLGYAVPAAIGGALACPGGACTAIVGDGGLLFTLQELATAAEQRLPIPILLWDNDGLGEIADFMRARQLPQIGVHPRNPDFEALARSFGCAVVAPRSLDELERAVAEALAADGPTVIHVRQDAAYLSA